jgi:hypothetical protein
MPNTTDAPAPEAAELTPSQELALLGQITRRVEKLGRASKVWLRDRLALELDGRPPTEVG